MKTLQERCATAIDAYTIESHGYTLSLEMITGIAKAVLDEAAEAAREMPFNERLWQTHERNDVARWLEGKPVR